MFPSHRRGLDHCRNYVKGCKKPGNYPHDLARSPIFLVAISLATVSTALLIAPVSSHRLLFHKHEKDALVDVSDILVKVGLGALGLTMGSVILLVFSVVLGTAEGILAATTAAVLFLTLWLVLP